MRKRLVRRASSSGVGIVAEPLAPISTPTLRRKRLKRVVKKPELTPSLVAAAISESALPQKRRLKKKRKPAVVQHSISADGNCTDKKFRALQDSRSSLCGIIAELNFRGAQEVEAVLRKALDARDLPAEARHAALRHCAGRGLLPCVRILLESGVPADGHRGKHSPLRLAAENGHVAVCRVLLDHGANAADCNTAVKCLQQFGKLFAKETQEILKLAQVERRIS